MVAAFSINDLLFNNEGETKYKWNFYFQLPYLDKMINKASFFKDAKM